jgi:hypothetical protein
MDKNERSEKIAALIEEIGDSLALLESTLPRQIDGFALSRESKLPWKVLLYRESLTWRIVELGRSAFESLTSERIVSGIVLTRATVEASAGLWYLTAKVEAVVASKKVGNVDEYLMKLAMGTATEPRGTDLSNDDWRMPRPFRIGVFLKQAEKDIEAYSHQYGVLSEFAHPNYAGTVLLYSNTNKETAITDFGRNIREADTAKSIGALNLSVALGMFRERYNRISDLLPAFIGVCEGRGESE